ncbi:IclR family transcriptional regulator domain-containing protein [Nocardia sp. R6R-6]|uniref:IclR family transcriptional regulator domain-containing protein n=1 Tax=Nocardia sp. R6R-6 TaxID=3459303 RepID=UPI00403DF174
MADTSAERVAALLRAFGRGGDSRGERSVSDLARAVGRERSQVSRMLKALERGGLVEQLPDSKRYRLGWSLLVLATGAGDTPLLRAARPVLQALVSRVGEVALLSVQQGNRSLTVLREESHQSLRAGGWVGRSSPMHCTASGRALLFDSDDELVETLTAEDLLTPISTLAAPADLDELLQRLNIERAQGYSVASEEVEIGLTSVSTPVRDRNNTIISVINVSGPTSRLITHVEDIAKLLKSGSTRIQRTLTSPDTPAQSLRRG